MNKTQLLLIAGIIGVILVALLIGTLKPFPNQKRSISSQIPVTTQSPNPVDLINKYGPLSVVSVNPPNQASEVPLGQPVQVKFNRSLLMDEISVSFGPGFNYSTNITGNMLTITPGSPLEQGITYSTVIGLKATNEYSTFTFTTTGPTPSVSPDTRDPALSSQVDQFNLQNHPDTYLANKMPHSETLFSAVEGGFKPDSSAGHDYFIVTTLGSDQGASKTAFLNWLNSTGLSDSQIQNLDVVYITQEQAQEVANFKALPPYNGENFTMDYNKASDSVEVIIYNDSRQAGEQEFDAYLQKNGIQDPYWINNLTITYQ